MWSWLVMADARHQLLVQVISGPWSVLGRSLIPTTCTVCNGLVVSGGNFVRAWQLCSVMQMLSVLLWRCVLFTRNEAIPSGPWLPWSAHPAPVGPEMPRAWVKASYFEYVRINHRKQEKRILTYTNNNNDNLNAYKEYEEFPVFAKFERRFAWVKACGISLWQSCSSLFLFVFLRPFASKGFISQFFLNPLASFETLQMRVKC